MRCRVRRDHRVLVEGDAAREVARPRQPDLERHRPRVPLLAIDAERPGRCPPTRPRRDVDGAHDAVVLDQERQLAAKLHLDPAAGHPQPGLGACCPLELIEGRGAEDAVARKVRPLLESQHRRRGLRVERSGQPRGSHEAEIDQSLLNVARRGLVLLGRLDRGRHRLSEVVAGEEPDRHASVDQHVHPADAGNAAKGADELADAVLEQPAVAAGGEARPQVDGDDAMRDRDRAQRGRARNGRADATAALGRGRPGEQLLDRLFRGGAVARHGNRLSVRDEPDVHARAGRAGEHERRRPRAREKRCISWQSDSPPQAAFPTDRQISGNLKAHSLRADVPESR